MATMICRRLAGETWREAVARIARKHGLEYECLSAFDNYVRSDPNPEWAEANSALCALQDWDLLEYSPEPMGSA